MRLQRGRRFRIVIRRADQTVYQTEAEGYGIEEDDFPFKLIVHRAYNTKGEVIPESFWQVSELRTGCLVPLKQKHKVEEMAAAEAIQIINAYGHAEFAVSIARMPSVN